MIFFWFSRFEFALKESNFLKNERPGANAEPGWKRFEEVYATEFEMSEPAKSLIRLNPLRQVMDRNQGLIWREAGRTNCKSELCLVILLLKTIRNNLFHGGKHGADGWDDPERTKQLLIIGKDVLDALVAMAGWEADYTQYY